MCRSNSFTYLALAYERMDCAKAILSPGRKNDEFVACRFAANEGVYGWRPQAIWICALLAAAPKKGRKQSSEDLRARRNERTDREPDRLRKKYRKGILAGRLGCKDQRVHMPLHLTSMKTNTIKCLHCFRRRPYAKT